jgi:hypothetical protein
MPTPTITKHSTRPAVGLTTKGGAIVALIRIRDQWDSLTPAQQQECADLVARLSVALRRETVAQEAVSRPLPLVGRISA